MKKYILTLAVISIFSNHSHATDEETLNSLGKNLGVNLSTKTWNVPVSLLVLKKPSQENTFPELKLEYFFKNPNGQTKLSFVFNYKKFNQSDEKITISNQGSYFPRDKEISSLVTSFVDQIIKEKVFTTGLTERKKKEQEFYNYLTTTNSFQHERTYGIGLESTITLLLTGVNTQDKSLLSPYEELPLEIEEFINQASSFFSRTLIDLYSKLKS